MWVRGLKRCHGGLSLSFRKSHPMWVRGLKPPKTYKSIFLGESHPMWVRGLKLIVICLPPRLASVAPHVGAWIET